MKAGGHYRQMYRLYFGLQADGDKELPADPPSAAGP
jgi:hypothetical protein